MYRERTAKRRRSREHARARGEGHAGWRTRGSPVIRSKAAGSRQRCRCVSCIDPSIGQAGGGDHQWIGDGNSVGGIN